MNTPKARALAALGAEVVAADVDDQASLERAFAGAHGAYCVTFFWDHFSPGEGKGRGAQHGRGCASAAKLQHVIWSTLEDTRKWVPLTDDRMPTLMGSYKVPHFDAKGESDARFTEAGVPTTFLLTSFYWENFIYFGMGPKPGPDGKLAITMPDGATSRCRAWPRRTSASARSASSRPAIPHIGRTVGIAGGHLTGTQMAAAFSRALGKEVGYNAGHARDLSAASVFPARTTWATCSSSMPSSRTISPVRATSTWRARSIRSCRRSTRGSRPTRTASR